MKKIIVVSCLVCLFNHCHAQNEKCDGTAIMEVKGSWKKVSDANMRADKNQAQMISRIDAISKMYQSAYTDMKGIGAEWYRTMEGSPVVTNGPATYQFNSLYRGWYCNQNLHKLMLGGETGTWSLVYFNSFGWLMTSQYDLAWLTIEGETAWLLPKKVGEWKGLTLYDPHASASRNYAVLITRNGQLPYKPVTRQQFLLTLKQKIEEEKKGQQDVNQKIQVRSAAEEEAAKQKGLLDIEKNNQPKYVEQRKNSYLKNYKTDEQRKQETIQRTEDYFNGRLKPINDELNNETKDDLQQPAIVMTNYLSSFKGFTTEEDGGRRMVLINNDYFNKTLPRYIPQMIVLYWSWDKSGPTQYFKKQLEDNFPVEKLKEMIDK
ncbi:MAG TPA: hypothetical protein VLJ68_14220 [Chitinophagaceae bacterium]|nr:hypothetical protein [Chitinophagaceae bacterium]